MDDNLKFAIAINNLDRKIAELNIKITKAPNDSELKDKLSILIKSKEKILSGNNKELKELIEKYGSKNNE